MEVYFSLCVCLCWHLTVVYTLSAGIPILTFNQRYDFGVVEVMSTTNLALATSIWTSGETSLNKTLERTLGEGGVKNWRLKNNRKQERFDSVPGWYRLFQTAVESVPGCIRFFKNFFILLLGPTSGPNWFGWNMLFDSVSGCGWDPYFPIGKIFSNLYRL